jgi:hypothetical protein
MAAAPPGGALGAASRMRSTTAVTTPSASAASLPGLSRCQPALIRRRASSARTR